ncbi:TetR/AcrR family transcriptional regulator [Gordonia polyisoprenivorans]|uniref:TetR/AcrR family transcriptional regulator n=1 Tax=Gordonia polyisoprenivorans TaxID=84595 RepID=UPI0003724013|nr:TetR/AcrR family transcriptional regulator [Gordonia polyisoprenivorans]OZC29821.1 TetR/AcrR family transcriptional regulator [Gordonia polyisoprenivorans]UZF58139.1 TetR/AcrR family transcriptional regulator; helix-turn-helix transcriptional regulator [Gordonia polyisoprenivorans]
MTSLLDEPRDRRRRRTRAVILDAAAELFAQNGFRATSVDGIAERADIALTTLYGNFGDGKAQVYAVLAVRMAHVHDERMRAVLADRIGSSAAQAALEEYVRFHRDEPLAFRLLGLSDVDESAAPAVAVARTEIADRLRAVVEMVIDAIDGRLGGGAARRSPARRTRIRRAVVIAWAGLNGLLALGGRGLVEESEAGDLIDEAVRLYLARIDEVLDA